MLNQRRPKATATLGVEDEKEVEEPSFTKVKNIAEEALIEEIDYKDVLGNLDYFSSASNLKGVKEELILKKKTIKFIQKFKQVLSSINTDLIDKNDLFLAVIQSAEDYIYIKDADKCARVKDELCVELLKGYVNGDEAVCRQIIQAVSHKVKKTTVLRRNKKAIIRAFFLLVKCLLKTK